MSISQRRQRRLYSRLACATTSITLSRPAFSIVRKTDGQPYRPRIDAVGSAVRRLIALSLAGPEIEQQQQQQTKSQCKGPLIILAYPWSYDGPAERRPKSFAGAAAEEDKGEGF